MQNIVDAFSVSDPCNRMLISWITAVAVCVIVVGSTVVLATVINPGADFPVAISRKLVRDIPGPVCPETDFKTCTP